MIKNYPLIYNGIAYFGEFKESSPLYYRYYQFSTDEINQLAKSYIIGMNNIENDNKLKYTFKDNNLEVLFENLRYKVLVESHNFYISNLFYKIDEGIYYITMNF